MPLDLLVLDESEKIWKYQVIEILWTWIKSINSLSGLGGGGCNRSCTSWIDMIFPPKYYSFLSIFEKISTPSSFKKKSSPLLPKKKIFCSSFKGFLKKGGGSGFLEGGGGGGFKIFEVLRLFWCPFTHTLCYGSKITEYNQHCKHCMLISIKFKVYECSAVKIFKNKTLKIFKRGGGMPSVPGWIRLWGNGK